MEINMTALTLAPISAKTSQQNQGEVSSYDQTKSVAGSSIELVGSAVRSVSLGGLDLTGRIAEGIDFALDIPRQIGGLAAYIPVPAAKEVGYSVGALFSGVFSALFHGGSVGTFKWLQYARRQGAVDGAMAELVTPDEQVSSASVKSFLALVKDTSIRNDLTSYVGLVEKLADISTSKKISEIERTQESAVLNTELAALEVRLARNAELNELKKLLHAPNEASLASEVELHYLATRMADTMIQRTEDFYKNNSGLVAFKVSGDWSDLAAQGDAGREALVTKIERKLLDTYLAERNGAQIENNLADIRTDVSTAFKTQSAFREAVMYTTLGVLSYTGLLSTVVTGTIDGLGQVTNLLGGVLAKIAPAWVNDLFANALFYAQGTAATVLGYFGIKSAVQLKGFFGNHTDGSSVKGIDAHQSTTDVKASDFASARDTVRVDAAPHADTTVHSDGAGAFEALKAQLDAVSARTDAVASGLHQAGTGAHGAAEVAARIPATVSAPHTVPHMDLRTTVQEGIRVDPSVRVEAVKVTPR
jgi:hypothetical protein